MLWALLVLMQMFELWWNKASHLQPLHSHHANYTQVTHNSLTTHWDWTLFSQRYLFNFIFLITTLNVKTRFLQCGIHREFIEMLSGKRFIETLYEKILRCCLSKFTMLYWEKLREQSCKNILRLCLRTSVTGSTIVYDLCRYN
jgi:hypothetical protein